ncbi:TPA: DUF551 domain-containing protein [Raoultella ornithinolytica]
MTSKLTITRERMQEIAEDGFLKHGESKELARMALAAMDCEPVAYIDKQWTLVYYVPPMSMGLKIGDKLYRHAQPAQISALKLPPKLSNDRESSHELNTGVDTWNRCIDEVAKINGEMIIAGRLDGLHPSTAALVNDFATALAEKLRKAELKYGYSNAWTNNGWMTECLADFHRHIAKGDPRDVAAYCAFMWHHGWKTEAAQPAPVVTFYRDGIEAAAKWIDQQREAYDSEHGRHDLDTGSFEFGNDTQREYSSTMEELAEGIRALHPNAGNSPVIPDGYRLQPISEYEAMCATVNSDEWPQRWIPVSERMPEDRTQVILWDAEIGEVISGHYSHKTHTFYHCGDAIQNEITHWMPLPAAPQEVK